MLNEEQEFNRWLLKMRDDVKAGSTLYIWELEKIRRELADIKLELKLQRLGESPHHKTGKKQKPE